GKFVEAQEPIRQKIALLTEKKGKKHFETGNATRFLKTLEQVAALPEEARAEFAASYQVYDEMFRLKKKGRVPDAAALAKRVWEMRRRVLGAEHELAAVAAVGYAQLLYFSSRYAEAEPLFRGALVTFQRIVGENHPAVGSVSSDLAVTLNAQGKYAAATPLFEAALKGKRSIYGEDHPETAVTLNNLAMHLDRLARFGVAEPLHRQALDILLRAEGEDGPHMTISR